MKWRVNYQQVHNQINPICTQETAGPQEGKANILRQQLDELEMWRKCVTDSNGGQS